MRSMATGARRCRAACPTAGWSAATTARRLAHVLVQQIFEDRARLLEAVGADVGQIVGRDVHLRLLRFHAGLGDP
jgi:hypothetical protein